MPQPRKRLPRDGYEIIIGLAERGVSETDIAKGLGMSFPTWYRIKNEDPKAKEALDAGRAIEHDKLFGVLFEAATEDGNTSAAMFLLKCRHGYREQVDLSQQNEVKLIFEIPAALSRDSYNQLFKGVTVDHEP